MGRKGCEMLPWLYYPVILSVSHSDTTTHHNLSTPISVMKSHFDPTTPVKEIPVPFTLVDSVTIRQGRQTPRPSSMKMGCMKTISNCLTRNSDSSGLMKVCNNSICRLRSISVLLSLPWEDLNGVDRQHFMFVGTCSIVC